MPQVCYPLEFDGIWQDAVYASYDQAPVIVGDRFVPVAVLRNHFGYTNFYNPPWSYDNPCRSLAGCYPMDIEHHWFGLFFDASGFSIPVEYRLPEDGQEIATVTAGRLTFEWIHGDRYLAEFLVPIIATEITDLMICDGSITDDDGEFEDVMPEVYRCNQELVDRLPDIQKLKTKAARERNYIACTGSLF